MKKQLFQWSTLLCLIVLALATRWGDVAVFIADWWFAAAVVVLFAAFCIWWIPGHGLAHLSLDWSSFLFIGAFLLLTILSPYRYGAQVEAAKLGAAFLLAFMVLNLVQDHEDLQFYMNGILALGVGMAAIVFVYYIAALSPATLLAALHTRNLYYHFVVNGQIWGLWQYPNTYAGFVDLCVLLAFGMAAAEQQTRPRILYDACAGFLLMVLYLTGSRGAFLTAFIGFIALILLTPRSSRGRMLLRIFAVGAAAVVAIVADPLTKTTTMFNIGKSKSLGKFVAGQGNTSLQTRLHMLVLATHIFKSHPWAGTGLGTFGQQWTAVEWKLDNARRIDPHSFFFRFLAETGILGTVPLFAWIVRRGICGLDHVRGSQNDMAVTGLWAGTLTFFLHMCMDVDYVYAVVPAILFFCLALLASRKTAGAVVQTEPGPLSLPKRMVCLVAAGLALLVALLPLTQRGIGSLYADAADRTDTAKQLSIATTWDPGNDVYWNELGNAQTALLKGGVTGPATAAARAAFRRACVLAPDDYRAWWNLGMLELSLKDPDAVTCLERAEQLYPTLAEIKGWAAVARIYVNGDTAGAEAIAAKAFALAPGQAYAVTAQGFCALKQKDYRRALTLFSSATTRDASNRFAYFGLSLYYRATHDPQMERTELLTSRNVNPNLVEAMKRLRELPR